MPDVPDQTLRGAPGPYAVVEITGFVRVQRALTARGGRFEHDVREQSPDRGRLVPGIRTTRGLLGAGEAGGDVVADRLQIHRHRPHQIT
jgi:hypothetical protein